MGLFGGLFDKKICANCGAEAGRIFNYKISEGILCKECAGKLSPWFKGASSASLQDIQAQLAYREENAAKLASFNPTRTYDAKYKIMIDENQGTFIVATTNNWRTENPDIIELANVTGCNYDIDETRIEIPEEEPQDSMPAGGPAKGGRPGDLTKGGKQGMSMNPNMMHASAGAQARGPMQPQGPRYTYEYDFDLTIHVNHPYFDEISFRVNERDIEDRYGMEYAETERICQEIKASLMDARGEARAAVAAAAAPKTASVCPHCGATCIPDANGCCEYCGGAM